MFVILMKIIFIGDCICNGIEWKIYVDICIQMGLLRITFLIKFWVVISASLHLIFLNLDKTLPKPPSRNFSRDFIYSKKCMWGRS